MSRLKSYYPQAATLDGRLKPDAYLFFLENVGGAVVLGSKLQYLPLAYLDQLPLIMHCTSAAELSVEMYSM